MVARLKLTKIGNSVGAILPRSMLASLNAGPGDTLFVTAAPGGFRITSYAPELEEQMNLAREIMRKRRDALRDLAE